jgi:hypothetical protein
MAEKQESIQVAGQSSPIQVYIKEAQSIILASAAITQAFMEALARVIPIITQGIIKTVVVTIDRAFTEIAVELYRGHVERRTGRIMATVDVCHKQMEKLESKSYPEEMKEAVRQSIYQVMESELRALAMN